ncbi:MAG: coenzyme F420-0:L-glutamate ligase [Lactobacillaceae bacterium]|nr:coenzyme F420-0:L-glutamate ligase [Lactobacillaceae bacterium]
MSKRKYGTVAVGVRAPIIKEGDDIISFVTDAVIEAAESGNLKLGDKDIVGITEAVVARAQGNYAKLDDIAADIKQKFPNGTMGVIHPILSRNRFALLLKAFARGVDKLYLMLSYPFDEVGNPLISQDKLDESGINPYKDTLSEKEFCKIFGDENPHLFTGVDYIKYYKSISPNIEIILSNDPSFILNYTKDVLCADIHTRRRTRKTLKNAGANIVLTMDDILSKPINKSGFNPDFGVLGSNMATDEKVKLFPRNGFETVNKIQQSLKQKTGKNIEVMIYGDGGFKDPVCGIWELADPVVSPGYTKGLEGSPSELKIKFLADNKFAEHSGEELEKNMKNAIKNKRSTPLNDMSKGGTTPRRYIDLIGSLCDLVSGSGEKGTPIVLIQGYFDDYATE